MTHPSPSPDPDPMPTPLPTPTPFVEPGRREKAFSNAFELLVLAELARADEDVASAAELHARACWELDAAGMHGPLILAEITRMLDEAHKVAIARRATTPPWVGRMLRDLSRLATVPEPETAT